MTAQKAANVTLNLNLARKPSGCVLWVDVDDALNIIGYRWFGSKPGMPLKDTEGYKVAKHVKANKDGEKAERPNQRMVPKAEFEKVGSLSEVIELLIGKF